MIDIGDYLRKSQRKWTRVFFCSVVSKVIIKILSTTDYLREPFQHIEYFIHFNIFHQVRFDSEIFFDTES